jgi:hypothetical protein
MNAGRVLGGVEVGTGSLGGYFHRFRNKPQTLPKQATSSAHAVVGKRKEEEEERSRTISRGGDLFCGMALVIFLI